MIRKFKAMGLSLVAIFAMSAFVASAAQATAGTLTTFPKGSTVIATAEQTGEHEFTLTDQEVEKGKFALTKCGKAVFVGTEAVSEGATSIRVHPTYSECIAFGLPATITTTGCDYVLNNGTPTADGKGWHVSTNVACNAGVTIKIVTATCEVTVGSQNGLATSQVTNAGSASPETAMDLILHTNITGIKYSVTKDGIGCPLVSTGTFNAGDYKGTSTVKAHNSVGGGAVGGTIHNG